jgi:hypothetical protein
MLNMQLAPTAALERVVGDYGAGRLAAEGAAGPPADSANRGWGR